MIDGLKYIRDLKAFARGDIQRSDLPRLEAELYGTNDRARVAMLGSFVAHVITAISENTNAARQFR